MHCCKPYFFIGLKYIPTTCIIFYGFVANLRKPLELLHYCLVLQNYCLVLQTIAIYCLLLSTIAYYCQLLAAIAYYCQHSIVILRPQSTGTLVWEIYTPCGSVPERLLYKFPTVHFEINPLFSSTILCIYIYVLSP